MTARPITPPVYATLVATLLAAYAAGVVALAFQLAPTADERLHLTCGNYLATTLDWTVAHVRYQGPLGLLANQLFASGAETAAYSATDIQPLLIRGRLGIAVVAVLAALTTFVTARLVAGRTGGLVALALFVTNPMLLGHGALATIDMVHTCATIACVLAVVWSLRAPGVARAAVVGASCGLAVATKYLAVVFVPVAALVALVGLAASTTGPGRSRLARIGLGASAMVAGGLFALHAAYAFTQPFAHAAGGEYASALMAERLNLPGVRHLVAALPLALAQGLDQVFAFDAANAHKATYFFGEYRDSLPAYYPVAVSVKTPVALLAAFAVGALALVSTRLDKRRRASLAAVLALVALPMAALTLGTDYKTGVRYVLQLMPLMAVVAAFAPTVLAGLPRPARRGAAAALVLAIVPVGVELARHWPNAIAYYNLPAGGTVAGLDYFADSNTEWDQLREVGLEQLEAELGPLQLVTRTAGPRFGRVAIYFDQLIPIERDSPGAPDHWLLAFEPIATAGAAWYAFDVAPEDFEAAVAGGGGDTARRRAALAYLGEGQLDAARRHLAAAGVGEGADPLQLLVERLERGEGERPRSAFDLDLAAAWSEVGRFDRAEDLLAGDTIPRTDASVSLHARVLSLSGRLGEAVDLLADVASPSELPASFLFGCALKVRQWRELEVVEALEASMHLLPESHLPAAEALLEMAVEQAAGRPTSTQPTASEPR